MGDGRRRPIRIFRLQISGVDGSHLGAQAVDRTRPAHDAAQTVERAIAAHLGVRA